MNLLVFLEILIFLGIILNLYGFIKIFYMNKRMIISDKKLSYFLVFNIFFSGSILALNHILYLKDLEFEANQGTKINAVVDSINYNINILIIEYVIFIISFIIFIKWFKNRYKNA